jgi:hypothetical protein
VLKLCGGCGVHGCIRSLTFFFNSGLFYAACSPPESPKHSDTEGIVYWQVRTVLSLTNPLSHFFLSCLSFRLQKCELQSPFHLFTTLPANLFVTLQVSLRPSQDRLWSLGAPTWKLAHGDLPFSDVQDMQLIVDHQLLPVPEAESLSRSFHDLLHWCSHPVASRPDPDELLNVHLLPPSSPLTHLTLVSGLGLHARTQTFFGRVKQSMRSGYLARMMFLFVNQSNCQGKRGCGRQSRHLVETSGYSGMHSEAEVRERSKKGSS